MALKGLRVVEIAGLAPVPFCGMLFADFGATVIRVDKVGIGLQMDKLARGKQSIAVNLKRPEGASLVKKLTSNADIFLDPFRPGVMEKLKLGPGDLMKENPRLIYGRISGYGQTGPYSLKAGHDINYVALSGVLSRLGRKEGAPFPPINLLADFAGGGLSCAFGILMALFERHSSGKGQVVDSSMTEGAAYVSSFIFKTQGLPLWGNPRGENWLDSGAHFYNTFKTKDGKYMAAGSLEPQFYDQLIQGLGFEGDDLESDQFGNFEKNKAKIADRFLTKTQEEWTEIFDGLDACVTPVLDLEEAYKHPQNEARQSFVQNPYTNAWEPEPSPVLSRTPGKANFTEPDPQVGQHTIDILKAMGYEGKEITQLVQDGVVEALTEPSKL